MLPKKKTRLARIRMFIKGFMIAGPIISDVERRTGKTIRNPKSKQKRHRIPADWRARLNFARTFAGKPQKDAEPLPSDYT